METPIMLFSDPWDAVGGCRCVALFRVVSCRHVVCCRVVCCRVCRMLRLNERDTPVCEYSSRVCTHAAYHLDSDPFAATTESPGRVHALLMCRVCPSRIASLSLPPLPVVEVKPGDKYARKKPPPPPSFAVRMREAATVASHKMEPGYTCVCVTREEGTPEGFVADGLGGASAVVAACCSCIPVCVLVVCAALHAATSTTLRDLCCVVWCVCFVRFNIIIRCRRPRVLQFLAPVTHSSSASGTASSPSTTCCRCVVVLWLSDALPSLYVCLVPRCEVVCPVLQCEVVCPVPRCEVVCPVVQCERGPGSTESAEAALEESLGVLAKGQLAVKVGAACTVVSCRVAPSFLLCM
jgi:hypothetical protein